MTTEEELRAYEIVKNAVSGSVPDPEAIRYNDTASYFAVQYNVTTRWFARFWIQDRDTKLVVVRVSVDRARELVPGMEWEEAPGGGARTSFTSADQLTDLSAVYVEAVQAVVR